jgi:hypothetical protein
VVNGANTEQRQAMWNNAPPSSAPAARATNGVTTRVKSRSGISKAALPTRASALMARPVRMIQLSTDTARTLSVAGRDRWPQRRGRPAR